MKIFFTILLVFVTLIVLLFSYLFLTKPPRMPFIGHFFDKVGYGSLYYLDKPNSSYIVHPALYNYQEISKVLEKYKKIQINELTYQLRRLPKLIEGDITDDIKNKYQKLDTEIYLSGNINFFDREKTVEIFVRKD